MIQGEMIKLRSYIWLMIIQRRARACLRAKRKI